MEYAYVVLLFLCGLLKWQNVGAALVCVSNDPVCGNDGKTYPNICRLSLAKANNRHLLPLHEGNCHVDNESQSAKKSHSRSGKRNDPDKLNGVGICHAIYSPVCGSDGVTYDNECRSRSQILHDPKFHIKHKGKCKGHKNKFNEGITKMTLKNYKKADHEVQGFSCPAIYSPVCGSDGVTYDNECYSRSKILVDPKFHIKHKGKCKGNKNKFNGETLCHAIYKPVCGSDGVTYDNECHSLSQILYDPKFHIKHNGKCKGHKNKLNEGITKMTLENCKKADHEGQGFLCHATYSPVCGSDGVTYDNECYSLSQILNDPKFHIKHNGECEGHINEFGEAMTKLKWNKAKKFEIDPPHLCINMYRPLCGSDGITYGNECDALFAKLRNPNLRIKRKGKCKIAEGLHF